MYWRRGWQMGETEESSWNKHTELDHGGYEFTIHCLLMILEGVIAY